MEGYKLIEDTIKVEDINVGGKVFDRGNAPGFSLTLCSVEDKSDEQRQQTADTAGRKH